MLPICLMFILGVFEYARYVMFLQLLNNAAREGSRYAITHIDPVTIAGVTYGNQTSDVTNVVNQYLAGQAVSGQQTKVYLSDSVGTDLGNWQTAQPGNSITVQITGTYNLVAPRMIYAGATLPVKAQASMRVESN